jgi:gliding motility-associated-like protein
VVQGTVPVVNLGNDTLVCGAFSRVLNVTQFGATYQWQDNSTAGTFTITQPGTYYVTVTNLCGTDSDTLLITSGSTPSVNIGNDQVLCTGQTVLLDATDANATGYQWQDNSTNATFFVNAPGTYYVTAFGTCGHDQDTIHILAPEPLNETLGDFEGDCDDDSIFVDLQDEYPAATFLWSTGETTPSVFITTSGTFYVTISYCGQMLTDSFNVQLKGAQQDEIFLPNAFTPNGDSINDTYFVQGSFDNTVGFQAKIFNRWGQMVYNTDVITFEWDGTFGGEPVPTGTYFLVVDMKRECEVKEDVTKTSTITLFR